MLEHVRQGGKPYDVRGNHICEMITELKVLARFNRASQGRVVEGVKQSVVQGAQTYYKSLRENIKRLSSPRGYTAYFESWHPASITEQDQLVEDIKTLFVEQTIDDRIEQALPLLAKIQQGREMKEAEIFENWVNNVTEGTWSLPETPEQMTKLKELMSGELIVGPDGTNATEQLYDLIGDDVLFDRIDALAAQDPRANVWDDTEIQARLQELGVQMPDRAAPDMNAQPPQAVAEEFVDQSPDETMDDPDQDDRIANFQKIGQPMDARVGGQRTTTGPDYQERTASVTGPDSRGMHKVTVTRNDDIASNYLTKNPPNNSRFFVSKDTNEADNIAAFESLQRMRHLSGMKLEENVLNDAGSTLAHIMTTYQRDVRDFAQTGEMSSDLYDALYDYYFDDMPYGVKKARSGDPYEWIGDRFAEDILSNAPVDTPHQSDGQTVGQVMSQVGTRGLSGRPAPLTECNYTMEGEYCPEHGLSECWSQGMYEDILSTGIQLAEDDKTNEGFRDKVLQTIFKTEPKIARSSMDNLGTVSKSPNALLAPARSKEAADMQAWNKLYPETPWTPASDEDLLKSFNHHLNIKKDFGQASRESMPNDFLPTGAARAARTQGAAFDAEKSMQGNQDLLKHAYGIDEADSSNPEIPHTFGSPEHLAHLAGLGKALQAGDRSALGKSNAALAAAQVGQGKTPWEPAPTPSVGMSGAAHAGQQGYDYQDEEPKGQAHSGQGGYNYYNYDDADQSSAETARLGKLRNPNVDPALAHMLINPNNPDAFAMQRDEEPDQSSAETARLNKLTNPNVHPDMAHMLTNPNNPDAWTWKRSDFEKRSDFKPAADQNDKDGNVNEADRAQGFAAPGFQSDWWKSTPAGQAKTQPAPAKTPSADVTKDPLFRAAMNRIDADNKGNSRSRYFLPHSDQPVVQPPGVGPQPEPDTDIPDPDNSHPVLTGTVNQNGTVDFGPYSYRRDKAAPPLSSLDNAPPLPNRRVASVRSLDNAPPLPNSRVEPVDVTRESREGDALLARIKSLALIK